jgi:hypothetical protein
MFTAVSASSPGEEIKIATALARIEQRQAAQEKVARCVIELLAVHDEKLNAILEAATREESEPGPAFGLLKDILEALLAQQRLLEGFLDTDDESC